MNQRVSSIRNIRTIKALRGEKLTIDLGKEFTGGTITSWMKKKANDSTYRSFEILNNRYLVLTKEKSSDYYDDSVLVESVEGKWYFDVEFLADGADESESKTIYTGTIFFVNDITGSNGTEVIFPGQPGSEFVQTVTGEGVDNTDPLNPVISQLNLEGYFELGVQADGGIIVALGDFSSSGNDTIFAVSDVEQKITAEARSIDNSDEQIVQSGSFNVVSEVDQAGTEGYTALKVQAKENTLGTGEHLLAHLKGDKSVKIRSNGIISSEASKADMDDGDDETVVTKRFLVKETLNTGNDIDLTYLGGNFCNMVSASSTVNYNSTSASIGGNAIVKINSATEPDFNNLVLNFTVGSGTGDGTINIGSFPYTIERVGGLTTSETVANNFVSANATSILSNTGLVVTNTLGVIHFQGQSKENISYSLISGGLTVTKEGFLSYKVPGADFVPSIDMEMYATYNGVYIQYFFSKLTA